MHDSMTMRDADEFFASLPDGFDSAADLSAAMPPVAESPVSYIAISGTAGKTAAALILAEILRAAGFRTGLYIAGAGPLSARLTVDGAPPDEAAYAEAAGRILEGTLLARPAAELAAACRCFQAAGCAFGIVELADGALAEALPRMPACAVTHIGPDGSGRSIERLAHDAAAVMRKGCVCVTAPGQPKPALTEIIVAAGKADCELVVPDEEDISFPESGGFGSRMDYGGYEAPLAFLGYHAACNAAVAVELSLALWRAGYDIPDEAILAGLTAARNRSSIRILRREPLVILDACRTPQQAAALLRVLQLAKVRHLQAVVGLHSEEGADAFFAALESGALPTEQPDKEKMPGMADGPIDRLYLTAPGNAGPELLGHLAEKARFHFEVEVCEGVEQALAQAEAAGGKGLLICGSEELALAAERILAEKDR